MKINLKFIIIVISSLFLLVLLSLGAIFFLNDKSSTFVKDGYILNLLSGNDEKYFFDEETKYHVNLSNKIIFNDKDNDESSVNVDSFVHYLDGDISFLKDGAVLDLNTVKDKIAKFYNIDSNVIFSYNNGIYLVNNGNKKITFNSFMGRISENKYIVAGNDLSLKLSNSDNYIKGEYFEILYEEKGVVVIQNQEVRYQVLADGVNIYCADVSIDLGSKIIKYMDKDIMPMTFITISGDENIDIIGDNEYKDSVDTQNDDQNLSNTKSKKNEIINNDDKSTNNDNEVVESKTSDISLVSADVTATSIGVTFDIGDSDSNHDYLYVISNSKSGKRVYEYSFSGIGEKVMPVKYSLTPDTNYLVSVISNDTYIYQTLLTTSDLGVDIICNYSSSDSISFGVKFDDSSLVSMMNIGLYKYDEKSDKYILQKDNNGNKLSYSVKKDDSLTGNLYEFKGLDSNSIYYLKADDFVINNITYSGVYDVTFESKTLKSSISNAIIPKATINSRKGTVTLSLDGIDDSEDAITSYTYYVYNADDIINNNVNKVPVIDPIVKNNASSVVLDFEEIGILEHDNTKLESGKNYIFYAVIEYFDNEKYRDFQTVNSDMFISSNKPYILLSQNTSESGYDKVVATIDIVDNSCTVPSGGRTCYDESNIFNVVVKDKYDNVVYNEEVNFNSVEGNKNVLRHELVIDNLIENSTYKVSVNANKVDMRDGNIYSPYDFPFDDGNSILITRKLSSLNTLFTDGESNASQVINTNLKFLSVSGDNEDDARYTTSSIKSIVLKLFKGSMGSILSDEYLLSTKVLTGNDVDFNNIYGKDSNGINITLEDTFGLSYDYLKDNDLLDENYTIVVNTYYEDVSSSLDLISTKEVRLTNNKKIYKINPQLLLTSVNEPISSYVVRSNLEEDNIFKGVYDDTIVKYIVTSTFHEMGLEAKGLHANKARYYVYEYYNNKLTKVDFYVKDGSKLKLVSANEGIKIDDLGTYDVNGNISLTSEFYISNGKSASDHDLVMRRGGKYFISCEVLIGESNDVYYLNSSAFGKPYHNKAGIFTEIESTDSMKQKPSVKMYPNSSTASSISYDYEIVDVDNAIYSENGKNNIYSNVLGSEESYILSFTDNKYKGLFTINNLTNNSNYSIYLKDKLMINEDITTDNIINTMFDGYYNIDEYNNEFKIFNDKNSVTFKVLFDSSFFNRITSLMVNLTDNKGHKLNYYVPSLKSCGVAYSTDNVNRCFDVDYVTLKNAGMQTIDMDDENTITAKIIAYYDSGLIKWDSDDYFIFQNNNTSDKNGDYLVFTQSGTFEKYDSAKNGFNIKTHYKYARSLNDEIYKFDITNSYGGYNINDAIKREAFISRDGLILKNSSFGVINSKVVKESNVNSSNNKFVFSSITPFISYNGYESILDGAKVNMSITGFDAESFSKEDGKYYFYVDVWSNKNDASSYKNNWNDVLSLEKDTKILRRIKYLYDPSKGNDISFIVDGLNPDANYYFTISAIMNNGVYYQFYDKTTANTKVYEFSSSGANIFDSLSTNISNKIDDDIYGNRLLNSVISLKYPTSYNFGLKYVVCDSAADNCSSDNFISDLSNNIDSNEVADSNSSNVLIPNDFVYGKDYMFNIYAVYELKNQDGDVISQNYYLLNDSNNIISVRNLVIPSIKIMRIAKMESGSYYIDASVLISDPDEVIVNKEFLFNVLGDNNNGVINLKDDGDNYVEISDEIKYQKKLEVISDIINIRITNLSSDTQYQLGASALAYLNNDSLTEKEVEVKKEVVTYSMHDYGFTPGKINLSATSKSIVTRFLGGTNFENVDKVTYSIGLWGNSEVSKISGYYEKGDLSHTFLQTSDEESMMYVIDPDELITNSDYSKNGTLLEKTFTVNLSFDIGSNVYNTEELIVSYSKEKK